MKKSQRKQSISPKIYKRVLRQYSIDKKITNTTVSKEKLRAKHCCARAYEKAADQMMMKLTCCSQCHQHCTSSFFNKKLQIKTESREKFWKAIMYKKAADLVLVKLTPED
jgi:hypothetical protein